MKEKGKQKTRVGKVVSDKMDKTVVVKVERRISHPKFKKIVTLSKKFKAHDQENKCKIGDNVKIIETRPLSKDKRWRILDVLSTAQ